MKLSSFFIFFSLNFLFIFNVSAEGFQQKTLNSSTNLVKAGNKYVTLLGTQVQIGETAPNFKVVNKNFAPATLSDFASKIILISVVPSLDTGVCSLQTKRFNEEVTNLSSEIQIISISNDLPFAQKRFCKEENIKNIQVLSDAVWRDFGEKYGLLIKDMGLLTRAVFIIDRQGIIIYKELVANISEHPNYQQALATLKNLTSPSPQVTEQISTAEAEQTQKK